MNTEPILLTEREPSKLDHERIGISYSGGGPLVVIELGIAKAFVERKIYPAVIAGASAGALAGAAHALDVVHGTGIQMARDLLITKVSDETLGLTKRQIIWRLLSQRMHTVSVGYNGPIGPLMTKALAQPPFELENATIGDFVAPRPRLLVLATDRIEGQSVVFPDATRLDDALVASSAIPGIFPWKDMTVEGMAKVLVDGGVVTNQPLSRLVEEGCGQIYVCAVGYEGGVTAHPTNAITNLIGCISLMAHQSTKLEEEYVRLWVGERGIVYPRIHPEINLPAQSYKFQAADVDAIMEEAKTKTLAWMDEKRMPWAIPEASMSPDGQGVTQ